MINKKKVGQNIKKARESAGFKQIQVTKLLDITNGVLSHIEHGRFSPNLQHTAKLCKILKITIEDLVKDAIY